MAKYITFEKQSRPKQRKTDTWKCINKRGGHFLGMVKWHSPWRRFAFYAEAHTLFDLECLDSIRDFIKERMKERV